MNTFSRLSSSHSTTSHPLLFYSCRLKTSNDTLLVSTWLLHIFWNCFQSLSLCLTFFFLLFVLLRKEMLWTVQQLYLLWHWESAECSTSNRVPTGLSAASDVFCIYISSSVALVGSKFTPPWGANSDIGVTLGCHNFTIPLNITSSNTNGKIRTENMHVMCNSKCASRITNILTIIPISVSFCQLICHVDWSA